jgi:putative PIN family toxin of toxin-antitoxin system
MRVILDTCVWVAAVRSRRGASFALLSEIPFRRFQFGISVPLFLEYKAKLIETVEKAQTPLSRMQIDSILSALAYYRIEVPIFYQLRPNLKDENDNMVFECAANFGASTIVTHNVKDFLAGELAAYEIEIMTPGDFIRELRRTK